MSTTPILDFFSDSKHWTKDVFARRANGERTYSSDPSATAYCLLGALVKFNRLGHKDKILESAKRIVPGEYNIVTLNDSITHEQLIAILREAGV